VHSAESILRPPIESGAHHKGWSMNAAVAIAWEVEMSVEERVAKIESDMGHVRSTLTDVKDDVKYLRGELQGVRGEVQGVRTELQSFKTEVAKEFASVRGRLPPQARKRTPCERIWKKDSRL
jgi:chromosome segregation ATPase